LKTSDARHEEQELALQRLQAASQHSSPKKMSKKAEKAAAYAAKQLSSAQNGGEGAGKKRKSYVCLIFCSGSWADSNT